MPSGTEIRNRFGRTTSAKEGERINAAVLEASATVQTVTGANSNAWAQGVLALQLPDSSRDEAIYKALEAVRAMPSEAFRAYALADLAPHVPMAQRDSAIREAFKATKLPELDGEFHHPLNTLAPHLPKDLIPDALDLVRTFQKSYSRFSAVAGLMTSLGDSDRETILRDELYYFSNYRPSSYLSVKSLIPYVTETLWPSFLSILKSTNDATKRADLQNEIAKYIPDKFLLEMHSIALKGGYDRLELMPLLQRLPKTLVLEILNMIRDLGDLDRMRILANIAPYLVVSERDAALKEALTDIPKIKEEGYRARALQVLAPCIPTSLSSQALFLARDLDEEYRYRVLAHLGHFLSKKERHAALSKALSCVTTYDEDSRLIDFGDLFPLLPLDLFSEGIDAVSAIKDDWNFSRALHLLVEHSPRTLPLSIAENLAELADRLEWVDGNQVGMLSMIARRAPSAYRNQLFLKAIDIACSMGPQNFPGPDDAMQSIAPYLPPSLLPSAFRAIREIESGAVRARAFAVLAPRLSATAETDFEKQSGQVIWAEFPRDKFLTLDNSNKNQSVSEDEEASISDDRVVEYLHPPNGGLMTAKGNQTDDAKWSEILDQLQSEIGLVETARMIIERASLDDRALIAGMVLPEHEDVFQAIASAKREFSLRRAEFAKPPLPKLSTKQIAAVKKRANDRPWAKRGSDGRSSFEWVRDNYSEWVGKGLLQSHLTADPALYMAFAKQAKRTGLPDWLDVPTEGDAFMRRLADPVKQQNALVSRGLQIALKQTEPK
jgi:hypothetical protein